jgi:DNA-directed RNA polymerase specialized sigma24 family protein
MSRPRDQPVELDPELPCPLEETPPDPLEVQRLGECVKGLAERERAVVSLTFFHEQTAAEVGEALGMHALRRGRRRRSPGYRRTRGAR